MKFHLQNQIQWKYFTKYHIRLIKHPYLFGILYLLNHMSAPDDFGRRMRRHAIDATPKLQVSAFSI